jgi:serine/threonine-protein kinase
LGRLAILPDGVPDSSSTFGNDQRKMTKGPPAEKPEPNSPIARAMDETAPARAVRGGNAPVRETITEDLSDKMLGEFRILRRLGRGGMAEVYLAEQTTLKRNVAIKVLQQDRVTDGTYLKRFQTEAMAAGSLSHPHIIQVLMIGEQEGIQYIAQEYVPGMNLREFLAKKGPPELAVAMRVIRQVASALQAAHTAGIVHRDIKPENIMITRKGDVKVADFGLAQLTQEGERLNLTQDGVTMGTPLYMSPEQVNGSKVDLRTDIYSLGVTCYHILSGAPPFRGETAVNIAIQHLKEQPEPLEQIRGDLPPLLCKIVHKMLAKDPDRRYQSAQALLKDLKRVTADSAAKGEVPASEYQLLVSKAMPPAAPQNAIVRTLSAVWHAPDWPTGRQVFTVLLLALVVAGASAGIGWVTRTSDPFLAPLPAASAVPKKESAASQYLYAMNQKDSIDAWQAVVDFSTNPADRMFRHYAEQHLATLYLAKRRYDEAQAIFDKFAEFSESAPQFRAFGLAGQAVLLNLNKDYKRSQQKLDSLQSPATSNTQTPGGSGQPSGDSARRHPVMFDLLDDKMRQAAIDALHRNIEQLNQQMSQEWDEIFKKHDASPPNGN